LIYSPVERAHGTQSVPWLPNLQPVSNLATVRPRLWAQQAAPVRQDLWHPGRGRGKRARIWRLRHPACGRSKQRPYVFMVAQVTEVCNELSHACICDDGGW